MRQEGRRHDGQERQRQLIEATIAALAKHGPGRISVRLIAAEAQASPGLVTHYFGSIDALVAVAATRLGEDILDALDATVNAAGSEHRVRLMALVGGCFRHPVLSARTIASWLAITGLAPSMPLVAEAQQATIDALRARIRRLMAACLPDQAHHMPASALTAVIEGLWTEMARDAASLNADEAERVTLHLLRSLGMVREEGPVPARETPPRRGLAWEPQRLAR